MLIGNGLLAGRFTAYQQNDKFLVFAAGVSNSRNRSSELFEREAILLENCIKENPQKIPVYFSTYSIYDPGKSESPYVQHKRRMENLITESTDKYFIFRVSNVAGKSANRNTVLNYLYYHITNKLNFNLWINACRNIIDIDDVFFIVQRLLNSGLAYPDPVNIGTPINYPVKQIVSTIETYTGIQSNYIEVAKGSCFDWDLSVIQPILQQSSTEFNDDYLMNILKKYF